MKDQSTNLRANEIKRNTQPVFLYFFEYETGGNFFFTNYDIPVVVTGATIFANPQTFISGQIKHNPFVEDTEASQEPVSIQLAATDVQLRKYFQLASPQNISVKIFRTNSTALPGPIAFADLYMDFSGGCISVGFQKYIISASFLPPILREDQQIPNFRYQKTCNYQLFGKFCTLNKADWTKATTITGVNRSNKTIDVADLVINGKTITDETFQGGYFTNSNAYKVGIIACEMLPAGAGVRLYLNYWTSPQIGDAITITAGCLKIPRICDEFYGNIGNYGGTPCIPITNPTINGISAG